MSDIFSKLNIVLHKQFWNKSSE